MENRDVNSLVGSWWVNSDGLVPQVRNPSSFRWKPFTDDIDAIDTECAALLRSFGIKAMIVDFPDHSFSKASHQSVAMSQRIANWLNNHFVTPRTGETKKVIHLIDDDEPAVVVEEDRCFVSPVYLQHHGHSRLIVGIEKPSSHQSSNQSAQSNSSSREAMRDSPNSSSSRKRMKTEPLHDQDVVRFAYIFDPSLDVNVTDDPTRLKEKWRKPVSSLKSSQYQLVYVASAVLMTCSEQEDSKTLSSIVR